MQLLNLSLVARPDRVRRAIQHTGQPLDHLPLLGRNHRVVHAVLRRQLRRRQIMRRVSGTKAYGSFLGLCPIRVITARGCASGGDTPRVKAQSRRARCNVPVPAVPLVPKDSKLLQRARNVSVKKLRITLALPAQPVRLRINRTTQERRDIREQDDRRSVCGRLCSRDAKDKRERAAGCRAANGIDLRS